MDKAKGSETFAIFNFQIHLFFCISGFRASASILRLKARGKIPFVPETIPIPYLNRVACHLISQIVRNYQILRLSLSAPQQLFQPVHSKQDPERIPAWYRVFQVSSNTE
ncbi:MAG: hypothetical protein U0T82_13580 [Bacteroidales bacterium]